MKLIKLLFIIFIFSVLYLNTYALNVEVNTDKNKISVGEIFNLNIQIEGDLSGDFNIGGIKGLENFEIINKSQSQSSASKIVIVNGDRKVDSKTIYNINYTLKAKKKGDFVIGPVNLSNSGSNITTNSLNIKVGGGGILLGNNSITNKNNLNNINKNYYEDEKNNIINNDENKNYLIDILIIMKNVFFVLFTAILLFILFYYLNNKEKFNNLNIEKFKEKIFKEKIFKEKIFNNSNNKPYEEKDNLNDISNNEVNNKEIKEEDNIEEELKIKEESNKIDGEFGKIDDEIKNYIYPNIEDDTFLFKIEDIFRNKLKNKYKIEDMKNKTYIDILSEIEDIKFYDKEKIKMLSNLFNKVKYSTIGIDNEELLELVRNI